jgi:uncharacterized membrane protein
MSASVDDVRVPDSLNDPPKPLIERLASWLWAVPVAASPGWVTYVLSRAEPSRLIATNADGAPGTAMLHMLAGALAVAGLWAWIARRVRARDASLSTGHAWLEAVLATRVLLLGPIGVAIYFDPEGFLSVRRPVLVLVSAALVAVSMRAWSGVGIGAGRGGAWLRRLAGAFGSRGPAMLLFVAVAAIGMFLVRLAILRHHGFGTRAFDLGIYDNIAWNTSHGHFLGCSLIKGGVHTAAHFDPIMLGFSLAYALVPRAETLIVLQAIWVLSGVIPVYLIAQRRLDDRLAATILALGFALYPSVHGVIVRDFHSLALLATPALWMLWCLDAKRTFGYWLAFAVALSTREDSSLFVIGIGVYVLLATTERRRGALTIGLAIAYLLVVKLAVMPDPGLLMQDSDHTYAYANRYRRLIPAGGGALDGVATLLTNPAFVLGHLLSMEKFLAAVAFLLPLGLLPLGAGRRTLIAAYGVAFIFLATHNSFYYPLSHYSSVLYPALFAAAPEGFARARAWLVDVRGHAPARARAMLLAYLSTCLSLGSLSMGALLDTQPFRAVTKLRSLDADQRADYEAFAKAISAIPREASVVASNRAAPHVTNRRELYIVQQRVEAEWMVVYENDLEGLDGSWVFGLIQRDRYRKVERRHGVYTVLQRQDPVAGPAAE